MLTKAYDGCVACANLRLMLLNKLMNAIMILEIEKWIETHANLLSDGVYSWRI